MKSPVGIFRFLLLAALSAFSSAIAAPGIVWHEPVYAHPDLGGPTMRSPLYEAADASVTIYQGFWKNGGANGDQNGGEVSYRFVPRGAVPGNWLSAPLQFHSNVGANQFWKAELPTPGAGADDVIEYFIKVTFTDGVGSNPETTYLHGGDLRDGFAATTSLTAAQDAPFSIRNRPGWISHSGNRIAAGDDLQIRVKTGYIGPDNDLASRWATDGAVYYTTDGSTPMGSLGDSGSAATLVTPLVFNGTEGDASGNGNAAWWTASLSGVLAGLDLGSEVRYRVGLWNDATLEEKFADHQAGSDDQVFVYQNGNLGDPVLTVSSDQSGTLNANYTTTKLFVDEIAGDSHDLRIVLEPGESGIVAAEVFTNLNRRDRAGLDADGDGYPDGISGPDGATIVAGDDSHYFKAYPMTPDGPGRFSLTLPANRTGAYRLTARWKIDGETTWRWYSNLEANRRDHAVTIAPRDARDIVLYEINVLNIEATGDTFETRSTIEDMHNAPGAPHNADNRWDLDYLKSLGANWLWFQPIHPAARDGREPFGGWGSGNLPYEPGSPYAVKNFFEVSPIMTKDFAGDPFSNDDLLARENRDAAMAAWQNFVIAADAKQVGIMLDAPFNHTAYDVELHDIGIELFQPHGADWSPADEIRNREARFFSRVGAYDQRATDANSIAAAPDRFDFGKWNDVKDVFFGVYSALVPNEELSGNYLNESDVFDATHPTWTEVDFYQGANQTIPRNVTRQVWRYFAQYGVYWLERTRPDGENRNSETEPGLSLSERYAWDARGIDGLRCDFGQGLPPQAWEYMINVARSHKWNFVMMSESLDGGAVTYRSNRHFDILNENIVFPLKTAASTWDYRGIFEDRRSAYGQGLVLINNSSHDEENYEDPWEALIRFGVASAMDGVPMIFPGQELGISKTTGYNHYELNFGKLIPHFKRYNSMQPIWQDGDFGNDQLYHVYAGIIHARRISPALRSSNRWFLDGDGFNGNIHAVAKYQSPGASPNESDVVIALANLDRNNSQSDQFKIPSMLADLLGLQDDRTYNVKNIAAYTAQQSDRRELWQWGPGITGAALKQDGFYVQMNPVPVTESAWTSDPFEAQYLKLYDITPPPVPDAPLSLNRVAYQIGSEVAFEWSAVDDPEGGLSGFRVQFGSAVGQADLLDAVVTDGSASLGGLPYGSVIFARVSQINQAGIEGGFSDSSIGVLLLDPSADSDGDGQSNSAEQLAQTNPLDASSRLHVMSINLVDGDVSLSISSIAGVAYQLQTSDSLEDGSWVDLGETVVATDLVTDLTHPAGQEASRRFYRIRVVP